MISVYTGNGVTKKFPLPAGYDGSEVYLIFPTGRSIKMKKDEGYTVSDGAVYFSGAVPAGVTVSFDVPEGYGSEEASISYVVIYNDGHIVEVAEDPAEYLAQSQKTLQEARKHYEEVQSYAEETITKMMELRESFANDFDGKLYMYTSRAQSTLENTAEVLKSTIHSELSAALLEIERNAQTVDAGLQIMELLKNETQRISETAADAAKMSVLEKCAETLSAYDEVKALAKDCEYYAEEAKSASRKAGLETEAAMRQKAEEELEMLKSLRMKLEADSEALNSRIDSAWEMLRGGADGR